jgi:NADPH:quinone reductase-like Zn-dependent oxidoreductase
MFGMPINRYGDASVFEACKELSTPSVNSNDVLIKIKSSSVNPIDLMKREGYGKTIFEKQRKRLFPWILGSDVSGIVKSVGSKITKFKEGDEVWGSTSDPKRGTYCEYNVFNQNEIEEFFMMVQKI